MTHFPCGGCTISLPSKTERSNHRAETHVFTERPGRCVICRKIFTDFWPFYDHFTESHGLQFYSLATRASDRLGPSIVKRCAFLFIPFYRKLDGGGNIDYTQDQNLCMLLDMELDRREANRENMQNTANPRRRAGSEAQETREILFAIMGRTNETNQLQNQTATEDSRSTSSSTATRENSFENRGNSLTSVTTPSLSPKRPADDDRTTRKQKKPRRREYGVMPPSITADDVISALVVNGKKIESLPDAVAAAIEDRDVAVAMAASAAELAVADVLAAAEFASAEEVPAAEAAVAEAIAAGQEAVDRAMADGDAAVAAARSAAAASVVPETVALGQQARRTERCATEPYEDQSEAEIERLRKLTKRRKFKGSRYSLPPMDVSRDMPSDQTIEPVAEPMDCDLSPASENRSIEGQAEETDQPAADVIPTAVAPRQETQQLTMTAAAAAEPPASEAMEMNPIAQETQETTQSPAAEDVDLDALFGVDQSAPAATATATAIVSALATLSHQDHLTILTLLKEDMQRMQQDQNTDREVLQKVVDQVNILQGLIQQNAAATAAAAANPTPNPPTSSTSGLVGAQAAVGHTLALDAPPSQTDFDWWTMKIASPICPRPILIPQRSLRCADNRQTRPMMYKKHLYNIYYALVHSHQSQLQQFLNTRFGDSKTGERVCLLCPANRRWLDHQSREKLARHHKRDHGAEFATEVVDYFKIADQAGSPRLTLEEAPDATMHAIMEENKV